MTRIRENDLILPALYIINRQPGITTSELIIELRSIFNPTGEDAEMLQGRSDDKFSQIVRNLVSHHTLDQKYGYTTLDTSKGHNYAHTITNAGRRYLNENVQALESLLSNDLGYVETLKAITQIHRSHSKGKKIVIFDENIFISEGQKKSVSKQVYDRSKLLRDKAIEAHTVRGRIVCAACGFDFQRQYGEHGKGYIEIHHQKPIYQYEDSEFSQLLAEALRNLIPLCSNCHRMIHRKRENPLSLKELKEIIRSQQQG